MTKKSGQTLFYEKVWADILPLPIKVAVVKQTAEDQVIEVARRRDSGIQQITMPHGSTSFSSFFFDVFVGPLISYFVQ